MIGACASCEGGPGHVGHRNGISSRAWTGKLLPRRQPCSRWPPHALASGPRARRAARGGTSSPHSGEPTARRPSLPWCRGGVEAEPGCGRTGPPLPAQDGRGHVCGMASALGPRSSATVWRACPVTGAAHARPAAASRPSRFLARLRDRYVTSASSTPSTLCSASAWAKVLDFVTTTRVRALPRT